MIKARIWTVQDLQGAIENLDPTLEISLDGCDCEDWLSSIQVDSQYVTLVRRDHTAETP